MGIVPRYFICVICKIILKYTKMKKVIYLILFAMLCSCNNEWEQARNENKQNKNNESTYKIPLEEVLSHADGIFQMMDKKDPTTRTASQRKIKNIAAINVNVAPTRSENFDLSTDSVLYLVNYQDDKGFALLGGDKRIDEVFAISNEGSFNLPDTLFNKGLNLFYKSTLLHVHAQLQETATRSTTSNIIWQDWINETYVSPRVKAKWSQERPFNDSCFTIKGEKAKAGCAAIALAQIMYGYGAPRHYNNHIFDWKKLHKVKTEAETSQYPNYTKKIAYLISEIGKNVNMNYGTKESGAFSEDVPKCLKKMKYTSNHMLVYDLADVFHYLSQLYIIYMAGNESDKSNGHAWVADGCLRRTRRSIDNDSEQKQTLFHFNWGWGGLSDGYYSGNVFDTSTGGIIPDSEQNSTHYQFIMRLSYVIIKPTIH